MEHWTNTGGKLHRTSRLGMCEYAIAVVDSIPDHLFEQLFDEGALDDLLDDYYYSEDEFSFEVDYDEEEVESSEEEQPYEASMGEVLKKLASMQGEVLDDNEAILTVHSFRAIEKEIRTEISTNSFRIITVDGKSKKSLKMKVEQEEKPKENSKVKPKENPEEKPKENQEKKPKEKPKDKPEEKPEEKPKEKLKVE